MLVLIYLHLSGPRYSCSGWNRARNYCWAQLLAEFSGNQAFLCFWKATELSASFNCEHLCRSSPSSASWQLWRYPVRAVSTSGTLCWSSALSRYRTRCYSVQLEGAVPTHLLGSLSALGLFWCDRIFLIEICCLISGGNFSLSWEHAGVTAACRCWAGSTPSERVLRNV